MRGRAVVVLLVPCSEFMMCDVNRSIALTTESPPAMYKDRPIQQTESLNAQYDATAVRAP